VDVFALQRAFESVKTTYIADGHHRSASAFRCVGERAARAFWQKMENTAVSCCSCGEERYRREACSIGDAVEPLFGVSLPLPPLLVVLLPGGVDARARVWMFSADANKQEQEQQQQQHSQTAAATSVVAALLLLLADSCLCVCLCACVLCFPSTNTNELTNNRRRHRHRRRRRRAVPGIATTIGWVR